MGGQVTGAECGRSKHIHVLVSEDNCLRLNKAVNFLRALEPEKNWSQGTIVDAALIIALPAYEAEIAKRLYPQPEPASKPAISKPAGKSKITGGKASGGKK